MSAPIRNMPELIAALCARRDELNISHETIDNIAGLQSGYTSKLLAPKPIKNLGPMSFGAVLGALGLAVVVVPDPDMAAKVGKHWIKRKRPQRLVPLLASAISIEAEVPKTLQIAEELESEMRRKRMQELGRIGGTNAAGKGGKRRLKTMKKRARQAAASHAARMRWSKRVEA